MTAQSRRTKGTPGIGLTRGEYERLLERLELVEDALHMRAVEAEMPDPDAWPADLVKRSLRGEHPLRLWREHRGLSTVALGERAKVPQSYISEIETGRKPGSVKSLRALAEALGVSLDDVVP